MPAAGPESKNEKNDHERAQLRRKSTGDIGKMAAQSQGIKQLMAAEKEAAQVVANSRKRKAQRLKEAKEEAAREIEDYRKQRESQFQEQQKKYAGSKDDFMQKVQTETQKNLKQIESDVEKNKEKVIERLLEMVYDIKPELHINVKLNGKGSTFEPKQLMMELTATGIKRQQNSLVYYCPPSPNQHVVFFQGDTQDLKASMEAQYIEISQWKEWCLENTCALLQKKFPNSAVWIVRPSRMLRSLFSCFHNFVQSSLVGVPTYNSTYGGLPQLEHLILNALYKVHYKGQLKMSVHSAFMLPFVIIGFSKGCVVLNQFLHELVNYVTIDPHAFPRLYSASSASSISSVSSGEESSEPSTSKSYLRSPKIMSHRYSSVSRLSPEPMSRSYSHSRHTSTSSNSEYGRWSPLPARSSSSSGASASAHVITLTEDEIRNMRAFLGRIKAFYWLDAGHSGGYGAWVTDDELLKMVASLKTEVHVHVTPQQVCDPHRVWIGEEEKEFVDKLKYYGATVEETLHFEHEDRSLEKHFRVLEVF